MKLACVLFVTIASVSSIKFPSNFQKCKRNEPNVERCYLEAAQNGISQMTKAFPHLNMPSLDPLEITELSIGAGSQGVVNVNQNFKNCKLYGIYKIKLDDFRFNFDEKYLDVKGMVPEIKKICEYELNGKILLLPIVGTGQSTVILKNVNATCRFDYEELKRKGKTYMNFNKQNLSLNPESISFDFENLFNGDKALGDNINKVLNENNKEVFEDVRKGYEDGIGLILLQIFHNVFDRVSMEEAFD